MRQKKCLVQLLCLFLITSCGTKGNEVEKVQSSRNSVLDVSDRVKEINTGDVLIGASSRMYVGDGYWMVADHKAYDKMIHVFGNEDYNHLFSVGQLGQGPYEITRLGDIGIDNVRKKFYVSDHGKMKIFSYDIETLMKDPDSYQHEVKLEMKKNMFPSTYHYVSDTLSYARVIKPTSNNSFRQDIAKWNMVTGEMTPMEYSHPAIKNKRSIFAMSMEKGFYVEAYLQHDLLSICDLDGRLITNIYGPDWNGGGKSDISTFGDVMVTPDYIIVSYSGGSYYESDFPTKLFVFDLDGDYLKTLDVKLRMTGCCYDYKSNRIVMSFDEDIQFGSLDLDNVAL